MTNQTENKNQTLEDKANEKVVLVVDDQYGQIDDPMIPSRYGNGKVPGYRFELEDACTGFTEINRFGFPRMIGNYDAKKVVDKVKSLKPFIVLLDMNYGDQANYGLEIMKALSEEVPQVPVIIHSSPTERDTVIKIAECISKYGAKEAIDKMPSFYTMKQILDKYA